MRRTTFLLAAALVIPTVGDAQTHPSISSVLEPQRQVKNYSTAVISPDGDRVAWVEGLENTGTSLSRASVIWATSASGGAPRRVTAASDGKNHRETGPSWSPDGR